MIIIIIIIIIALKGAILDFFFFYNQLQHVRSSGPGAMVCKSRAAHRALITCNMSCYVPLGTKGTAHLSSLTELKSHFFELYSID